jgi:hypothetical protein
LRGRGGEHLFLRRPSAATTNPDIKVFRVEKTESDVYIVCRTAGGWAGLKTKVVET